MRARLHAAILALLAAALLCSLPAGPALAAPGLPAESGLPLNVAAAISFVDLTGFKEGTGIFSGTVDLRLRWRDLRLARPAAEASNPPRVLLGAAAEAEAARIWLPAAEFTNLRGKPSYTAMGLRLYPDGTVEMMRRVTGDFATSLDVSRFPFDRQMLRLAVAVRDQSLDAVALRFGQDDLDFSRAAAGASLDGWALGAVSLRSEPLEGWNGEQHPQVVAALEVARQPSMAVFAIFIPLFASLVIPMLSIWLHRLEDGRFAIETFELVNIVIGGLFAVIALNFTVYASYEVLGSGDNPVSELFALNYAALAIGLVINVLFARFAVVERLFGRYVQEQLFHVLCWAVPLLVLVTAVASLAVAAV